MSVPPPETASPRAVPPHTALESGTGGGASISIAASGLSSHVFICPLDDVLSSVLVPGAHTKPETAAEPFWTLVLTLKSADFTCGRQIEARSQSMANHDLTFVFVPEVGDE